VKAQIEIVTVPVMLIVAALVIFLAAQNLSQESITQETVVQTQVALTEFKAMSTMNALLKLEQPSVKEFVRSGKEEPSSELESEIERILDRNNGQRDQRNYYINIAGTGLERGYETGIKKSIYLASPEGPKELEVGATR
jgi:hypothetical protein